MKKFIAITLLAVSFAPIGAMAQTKNAEGKCAKTECASKCEKKCDAKKEGCKEKDLFAGMNLTDQQKSQLKALELKHKESRRAAMAEGKVSKAQKADSTLTKEQRATKREEFNAARTEGKKEYLHQVREIVGEENYVIFLENMATASHGNHNKAQVERGKKDGKALKADKRIDNAKKHLGEKKVKK